MFGEFLERPVGADGGDGRGRQFEREDPNRFFHTAHLRWQMKADQFLLAERVTDTLVSLELDKDATVLMDTVRGAFPWRVVIACPNPTRVAHELERTRDWLGIGVDFIDPLPFKLMGRCSQGDDGREGVVAGRLGIDTETYGITCRHVLSSNCGSLRWPSRIAAPQGYLEGSPDAALINLGSPCFSPGPGDGSPNRLRIGETADIERLRVSRQPVETRPGRRSGLVDADVVAFSLGGKTYRGPHVLIVPALYRQFGIIWPLWGRAFSAPGDSGSWAIDTASSTWIGMVVGGYEAPLTGTYALRADYLVELVRLALAPRRDMDVVPEVFDDRITSPRRP